MANPTVEKLKVFGLRHGEKVAMGTVALIFFFCAYSAWTHPSIQITPEEVQKTAKDAAANLSRKQSTETILTKLTETGVKPQDFEKKVDAMQAGAVDVTKYKLDKPFVIPEPGAGLIRDMPEFLPPSQLYVHTGRGAVRVFAVTDEGKPIVKDEEELKAVRRKARAKGAPRSPLGGMRPAAKKPRNTGALAAAEKKKEDDEAEKHTKASIAGIEDLAKEEEKVEEEAPLTDLDKYKTKLRGYRFVTAVGKFDHKKQKELYGKALKVDPTSADPHYLRLEIERQELGGDNTWGKWTKVNRSPNEELLSIRTEIEKEVVPDEARINTLIDPLPFLEVGYWVGAHPASLVPKAMLAKKKPDAPVGKGAAAGAAGINKMGGGNANMGAADYAKMGGPGSGGAGYGEGMKAAGAGMSFTMPKPSARGASGAAGDFEKSSADAIMIRALDFDVLPDATYRYRVRVVFANPNFGWENVSPGVDAKSKELRGPWSPTTAEVNVPADIATYATGKTPSVGNAPGESVHFEVVAWNEQDGLTIVKSFDEAPGQIIGTKDSVYLPDDKGVSKPRQIDFTSHQVLADTVGGTRPAADIQSFGTTRMEVPVLALVVRADGMLVLRDQAKDATSGEIAEMKSIFNQSKIDLEAKSKKSNSTLGATPGGGMGSRGLD